MPLLAALIMLAGHGPAPLVFFGESRVSGDVVHLADVTDLSSLPTNLRLAAAKTPVARFVEQADAQLSSRAVAARARAALPALTAWLPDVPDSTIHIQRLRTEDPAAAVSPPGHAAPPPQPDIQAGDRLTLSVVVGSVVVERDVHALQAGRSGRALFVRSQDGNLLTARAP